MTDGTLLFFIKAKIITIEIIPMIKSSLNNIIAVQPKIKTNPSCIPRTEIIGTYWVIVFNFFEIPSANQTMPVPKPVEMIIFGSYFSEIAIAPINF